MKSCQSTALWSVTKVECSLKTLKCWFCRVRVWWLPAAPLEIQLIWVLCVLQSCEGCLFPQLSKISKLNVKFCPAMVKSRVRASFWSPKHHTVDGTKSNILLCQQAVVLDCLHCRSSNQFKQWQKGHVFSSPPVEQTPHWLKHFGRGPLFISLTPPLTRTTRIVEIIGEIASHWSRILFSATLCLTIYNSLLRKNIYSKRGMDVA